jgi:hypothetical protein
MPYTIVPVAQQNHFPERPLPHARCSQAARASSWCHASKQKNVSRQRYTSRMLLSSILTTPYTPFHTPCSKQPNPNKKNPNRNEEPQPNPPPHPRLLRHPQHPPHRPLQPDTRILETSIDLVRQRATLPNFIANRNRQLLELPDFLAEKCGGRVVVLRLELFEDRGRVLAFSVRGGGTVAAVRRWEVVVVGVRGRGVGVGRGGAEVGC